MYSVLTVREKGEKEPSHGPGEDQRLVSNKKQTYYRYRSFIGSNDLIYSILCLWLRYLTEKPNHTRFCLSLFSGNHVYVNTI